MVEKQRKDTNREVTGLGAKVAQMLKLIFHPPTSHATAKLSSFDRFDLEKFEALTRIKVQMVIADADETLTEEHHGQIPKRRQAVLAQWVRSGIRVVIYSNMKRTNRYDGLLKDGVELHTPPEAKPIKKGVDRLSPPVGKTIFLGDNLNTDGVAIQCNIPLVLFDAATLKDCGGASVGRRFQVVFRSLVRFFSDQYDRVLGRKVLRDEDFE